jgi:hypothetical protein
MGIRKDELGVHGLGRVDYEIRDGEVVYANSGPVRVMLTEERVGATVEPALADLSAGLTTVYGTDHVALFQRGFRCVLCIATSAQFH